MRYASILVPALLLQGVVHDAGSRLPDERVALREARQLYDRAIDDGSLIDAALLRVSELRAGSSERAPSRSDHVLAAYEGALVTLRARHGAWPPARLRHLREGLKRLDSLVSVHPEQSEIRFLRLMTCYHLPGVLGRDWSVRDDFDALANQLPAAEGKYPAELYDSMVDFVLENGDPTPLQRSRLAASRADSMRSHADSTIR